MAKNFALQEAARARQDEFYTSRSDIENEMKYYKPHFKGKTILCNCDAPYESEFFKYFALFFNVQGLKKLIATCYECIELLKEADIVATNPPHSLLREYVAPLTQYSKKFKGVRWFTNLEHHRHNETMILVRRYHEDPSKYPHYDNYDAIEVSKTVEIPCDYDGIMGVPITLLDKYNPKQFEILGITQRDSPLKTKVYTRNDDPNFADLNTRATIRDKDGRLRSTYARILIRKIADFI